jgi:hypothetical protein
MEIVTAMVSADGYRNPWAITNMPSPAERRTNLPPDGTKEDTEKTMSDTTKTEPQTLKLSFKKEELRTLDDNQLDLLDGVVGGTPKKGHCQCLFTRGGGCNTTGGDNDHN